MAETNGGGRLDRIEALLDKTGERLNDLTEKFHLMVDHHEDEFKKLMTWQVLTQDKMDKAEEARQKDREDRERESARLDARVDKLVSAIGDLISRIPPSVLQS